MEKFNWIEAEQKNSVAAHMVLECMSAAGIEQFGKFDSKNLEIELKINGIEVKFSDFYTLFDEQIRDYKEKHKEALLRQVKRKYAEKLRDIMQEHAEKMHEAMCDELDTEGC